MILGLAPVEPPRPSRVTKSAPEYTACSRSSSILPAASFSPIGLPLDFNRSSSTRFFKSSFVLIPGIVAGEWMSLPSGIFLISTISSVTFTPSSCPPRPGFVDWPILISIASHDFRFSSLRLYLYGTYSNIYLCAFSFSSASIPPSPLDCAVLTLDVAFERAIFISLERAPKDM